LGKCNAITITNVFRIVPVSLQLPALKDFMTIGVPLHKDSLSMTELRRLLLDWSSERKRYVVFLVEGSDDNTGESRMLNFT
jgi:hypothetical protein